MIFEKNALRLDKNFAVFTQEYCNIVLMAKDAVVPGSDSFGGFEMSIAMPDEKQVDALYNKWLAYNISIAQIPTRKKFTYEFLAFDINGHRLRVYTYSEQN